MLATTTAGGRRARAAGPMRMCCPISGAAKPGRTVPTRIAAVQGSLGTEFAKTEDPLYEAWLEAAKACGYPLTPDYNGKQQVGFGRGQYTIRDGRRSSTANAFLKPARGRANLTVATNAHSTRVLLDGTRAKGVEFVQRRIDPACHRQRGRSSLRPAPSTPRNFSCSQASGRRSICGASASMWRPICRSEKTCRIISAPT